MYCLFARDSRSGEIRRLEIAGGRILTLLQYARRINVSAWVTKFVGGDVEATYHLENGRLTKVTDYGESMHRLN